MLRIIIFLAISFKSYATVELKVLNYNLKKTTTFCHAEHVQGDIYFTAAHCVKGFKSEEISIDTDNINQIKEHNYYQPRFIYNQLDFAIIKGKNINSYKVIQSPIKGSHLIVAGKNAVITDVYETEFKVKFTEATVCLNDSGRGAFLNGKLIGILSRGDKNCNSFAYFSRADIIKEWNNGMELDLLAMKAKRDFIKKQLLFKLGKINDQRN